MGSLDHYEVLGVSRGASADEIKQATLRLVSELHPAFKAGNTIATEQLKIVRRAYEVLGDPIQRAEYDRATENPEGAGLGWRVVEPVRERPQESPPAREVPAGAGWRVVQPAQADAAEPELGRSTGLGYRVIETQREELPEAMKTSVSKGPKWRRVFRSGGLQPLRERLVAFLTETAILLLGSVIVAVLIKTFLIQPFYVDGPSMYPTLDDNDRVMISKLAYLFGEPAPGDVVVILNPDAGPREENAFQWVSRHVKEAFGIPTGDQPDFIKRVVALAGDEVEIRDSKVYVNGVVRDEPFINPSSLMADMAPTKVDAGHVWVMGDNRSVSRDSRNFGPVPKIEIVGKAVVRIWPLSKFGGIPH